MRYCPDCGTGHECTAETGGERAEVEIKRLETQRDIEVARINANASKAIATTEAESGTAHAEGVVEGVEAVLDAVDGGEPTEGEPIVVDAPADDSEPVEEMTPDIEPPPVVEVQESRPAKRGGWWDAYR